MSEVTQILNAIEQGDSHAADRLLPLVYSELRKLAAQRMANEAPGQTLQATALVHEAWLRLAGTENVRWDSRGHFFAAAADAMRRILIERARRRLRIRHGGGQQRAELDAIELASPLEDEQILQVHEALEELTRVDPAQAELVKLRFFVGLGVADTAAALGVSEKTVQRSWNYAKAWLYRQIRSEGGSSVS